MRYVYNVAYLLALLFAAPWVLWRAVRHGKYRQGLAAKLLGQVSRAGNSNSRAEERCIWFHAVSVGEVVVLEPLVRAARQKWPQRPIVISSTSRTGFELAQRRFAEETVTYAPLDFSWAVDHAMRRLNPEMLVLVELELWPNLIATAHRAGVRLAIVNGRLSANSARGYVWIRPLVARLLQKFDFIGAQNEQYADRFIALGAPQEAVQVTGSTKYDGARTDRTNPCTQRLATWGNLGPTETLFLAGSTQAPEEQYALEAYLTLKPAFPELRLALVPRHPERFAEVAELLTVSGVVWERRSSHSEHPDGRRVAHVLLIDTVGELADWWGAANVGFVGGSFGSRGGQNMIEPAAMGVATCFGPNTVNFREISETLVQADAAVVVSTREEMAAFVRRCLTDRDYAIGLGRRAIEVVTRHRGALRRTMCALDRVLGKSTTTRRPTSRRTSQRRSSDLV